MISGPNLPDYSVYYCSESAGSFCRSCSPGFTPPEVVIFRTCTTLPGPLHYSPQGFPALTQLVPEVLFGSGSLLYSLNRHQVIFGGKTSAVPTHCRSPASLYRNILTYRDYTAGSATRAGVSTFIPTLSEIEPGWPLSRTEQDSDLSFRTASRGHCAAPGQSRVLPPGLPCKSH